MKIKPAFKIQGCKYSTANWILEQFPENYENYDYVEPFAGAASILLNKKPSLPTRIEVLNDLDPGIVFIFRSLRTNSKAFAEKLKKIRHSESAFRTALSKTSFKDDLDHAVAELVLRQMSHGGNKKTYSKSTAWNESKTSLADIAGRLQEVHIFNKPAVHVINAFDQNEQTIIYCDPPDDMSCEDHVRLFECLAKVKGKVIVSGHSDSQSSKLYKDWKCVQKGTGKKASKTQCLWKNF
jgi:DNA adenine methylase